MAQVTTDDIITKTTEILHEASVEVNNLDVPTTVNSDTGIVTYPKKTIKKDEAFFKNDLKDVITAVVAAILDQIYYKGIDMGDSLATKLEVQPREEGGKGPEGQPNQPLNAPYHILSDYHLDSHRIVRNFDLDTSTEQEFKEFVMGLVEDLQAIYPPSYIIHNIYHIGPHNIVRNFDLDTSTEQEFKEFVMTLVEDLLARSLSRTVTPSSQSVASIYPPNYIIHNTYYMGPHNTNKNFDLDMSTEQEFKEFVMTLTEDLIARGLL